MKRIFVTFAALFISVFITYGNEKIQIPEGLPVNVDGNISEGEWDDAAKLELKISGNKVVNISIKHDKSNLLIVFHNNLKIGTYEMRFPEILFDMNNSKTTSWEENDYWFHVSATDCNSKGEPDNYDNCKTVQTDWLAEKNFTNPSFNNIVEISIPFTKIELDPEISKVFGIAFDVSNTFDLWEYYPFTAKTNNPSTWAEAELVFNSSNVVESKNNFIEIYPNPSNEIINIKIINPISVNKIQVSNLLGDIIEQIFPKSVNDSIISFSIQDLHPGQYYIELFTNNKILYKCFMKY